MLVAHGLWAPGQGLQVWAEDSDRNVTSPSDAVHAARPHPFAASPTQLTDLLAPSDAPTPAHVGSTGSAGTTDDEAADHGHVVLRLPSIRRAPLDSPEIARARSRKGSDSAPALLEWTVPVISIGDPATMLRVLEGPPIGANGASFRYLAAVASFATDLVAGGKVLPTLLPPTSNGTGVEDGLSPAGAADARAKAAAAWRPVIQGRDSATLYSLARAMPPVCRALPHAEGPDVLLADMLAAVVDSLVRGTLGDAGVNLVPRRRGRKPRILPVAEAWLGALSATDRTFPAGEGQRDEVNAFAEALAPWDAVGTGEAGPAHATFRLRELVDVQGSLLGDDEQPDAQGEAATVPTDPDVDGTSGEDSRWLLEFLLQSRDDPSLLVTADQVWSDDGSLGRWLADPQDLLLGELGRAARVFPLLTPGLRETFPAGVELNGQGAYDLLTSGAAALADAGFGVLLPSGWGRHMAVGLKLKAQASQTDGVVTKPGGLGQDQLVDFDWHLAVGEHTLSDEEIAILAAAKAPLVRLRGQWVAVDQQQLEQGLKFLDGRSQNVEPDVSPAQAMTLADVLAAASAHPDDHDTPLPVTSVEADGWLGDLLDGAAAQTLQALDPPAGLKADLRAYQERGLSWLAFLASLGMGSCLADDMGLGKTVQVLALECAQRGNHPDTEPSLLVCPMSLVGNWQHEARRFAPNLRIYVHHGPDRHHGAELAEQLQACDLVLTTYGTAARDIDELEELEWGRVVIDEAQAIKNAASRTAKAVKRLNAAHRVALTGTPVENRLAELWSIMDFLNPGLLGRSEQFRQRYATPIERDREPEPAERLRRITRPYILRRLKTDPTIIDDLPDKVETKEYCQLTQEQASLYQSVVDDMLDRIDGSDGIERRGNILAAMAKLKQVCDHPALLLHDRSPLPGRSGKLTRLEELVDTILDDGEKVLCFTQFTELADQLRTHLAAQFGCDVAYLHGGTPRKRRDELVDAFQSPDGPPVFLLSLKAGGTGLNLTAASHVVHFDRWWNPAVEDQATDRAFRIGQKRNVQVHKLICTGTLEEHIDRLIEEKKALADLVISDGEGWLTELSTDDLRDVFSLSRETVDVISEGTANA